MKYNNQNIKLKIKPYTEIFYLSGLLVLIFIFWDHAIFYPLKILVVFFHESSHALATFLTGGNVKELVIDSQQGGHVISLGGNSFIITSAGYLGSLSWGVLIYLASVKTNYNKIVMMALALFIFTMTIFLSRSLFSWLFGLLSSALMFLSAKYIIDAYNNFLLRLIGLTSIMYAPLDIYSDTISRSYLKSDAYILSHEFGGSTILWGVIWILISLIVIFYCFKCSLNLNNSGVLNFDKYRNKPKFKALYKHKYIFYKIKNNFRKNLLNYKKFLTQLLNYIKTKY